VRNEVEKFPFSRRARVAVKNAIKSLYPAVPPVQRYVVKKKSWIRRQLGLPEIEAVFEWRPKQWRISPRESGIAVKKGRVFVNLILDYDFNRVAENGKPAPALQHWFYDSYYGEGWHDHDSKFPWFYPHQDGLDTGVQVLPFNSQQGSFLLKKSSGNVWGVEADLEELKKAPSGLFGPHVI
jgi:hypothetical protein